MAAVVKDLGVVTAYAYAVEGGYEGTEEEFEELLGNIAIDLSQIENLSVTVSTLPAGSSATASYSNGVLSLGIPRGNTGATPSFSIGTVTTGAPGSSAAATLTGTDENPVLNLTIPQGNTGDPGEVPAAAIAPTEASSTASVKHDKGERFWLNGTLYIATADIAAGASIVTSGTGANAAADKIGDDVTQLNSALTDDETTLYNAIFTEDTTKSPYTTTEGARIATNGDVVSATGYKIFRYLINTSMPVGSLIKVVSDDRFGFYDSVTMNGHLISKLYEAGTYWVKIPTGATNLYLSTPSTGSTASVVSTAKKLVTTADIDNSAVTTAKIADGNVTTAKVADKAVTLGKTDFQDAVTDGFTHEYTDLTAWNNGYIASNGSATSSSKKITPLSAPVLLNENESLVINPGTGCTCAIGLFNYNGGSYSRYKTETFTAETELLYTDDVYISFDFGYTVEQGQNAPDISPSDFVGSIKKSTTLKDAVNSNTARITALESGGYQFSVLNGKKLVACGDSMTVGTNPGGGYFDQYWKIVADRNGMTAVADAVSGSTMTNVTGKNPFCVDRYEEIPSDFDYLTIWFGWNDGAYATVGTIEDEVDTTFYGAYKKVIDYFLTTYPTKKIGLIVPYMDDDDFQQAVRDVSNMFGVPCLDLPNGNQCSLVYGKANDAQLARRSALTYDGTHPNQDGHNFISTMYERFLLSL